MSNKIGIDLEAVSKQLEDSLKTIKNLAKETQDAINQMGDKFQQQAKNSANELKKTSNEVDKLKNGLKNFNPNGPNSPNSFWNAHHRYNNGLGVFPSSIISGFGQALNGNFGSAGSTIINGGLEAWGMASGNPVAMAVGKTVGKLFDFVGRKVDEATDRAERNMIRTTYLHSSIGGFSSTGYNNLLNNVYSASAQIGRMTNQETIQLFQTVAKASGATNNEQLMSDSVYAGQFGKAFGMDVNTSGRFFGQMRATGTATTDAQMKRLGTIIGEAVGKTGAFAKTDELMSAVSNFTITAERTTLRGNARETENYTRMLATMASGDIKDIQGFASLMQRADQAFRGGSGGEAGWNARLGAYQNAYGRQFSGLDLSYLMEGGLFASVNSVFGEGSNIRSGESASERARRNQILENARRNGTLNTTNAEVLLKYLRSQVGDNRLLLDDSFGKLTSLNTTQAHQYINGIDYISSHGGEASVLERFGLGKLSPDKLEKVVPILGKNKDQLLKYAQELKSGSGMIDGGLSSEEIKELDNAIQKGDKEEIQKVTMKLTANHEWEVRQGESMESHIKEIDNKLEEKIGQPLATIRDHVRDIAEYMLGGARNGYENMEAGGGEIEQNADGSRTVLVNGTPITIKGNAFAGGGSATFTNTEADFNRFLMATTGAESMGSPVWTPAMRGVMRANGAPESHIGKTIWHRNKSDGTTDWGRFQLNDGGTLQSALKAIGVDPSLANSMSWKLNNPNIIDRAGEKFMRDKFQFGLKYFGGDARAMFANHHLPATVQKAWKLYGADWYKHPEFKYAGYSLSHAINSSASKMKHLGVTGSGYEASGETPKNETATPTETPSNSVDEGGVFFDSFTNGMQMGYLSPQMNINVSGYIYDRSGHQIGAFRNPSLA